MNGQEDTNGSVCISKRCMHIFHKACIEKAIDDSRSCPLCRSQIARAFLVDNLEYEEQCKKWEANPEGYTLEAEFFKKYHKTPQEQELLAEDIKWLRGEPNHSTLADDEENERSEGSENRGWWWSSLKGYEDYGVKAVPAVLNGYQTHGKALRNSSKETKR